MKLLILTILLVHIDHVLLDETGFDDMLGSLGYTKGKPYDKNDLKRPLFGADDPNISTTVQEKINLLKNDEYLKKFKAKLNAIKDAHENASGDEDIDIEYDNDDLEIQYDDLEGEEEEYEEEEEEWDLNIWDEHLCATDHDYVIDDVTVPWNTTNRAHNTMPSGFILKKSSIPAAGLGVFAQTVIPESTYLGPYEGDVIFDGDDLKLDSDYAFTIYKNGEITFYRDAWHTNTSNWLRWINNARDIVEQNIEPVQCFDNVYYRTIKGIPSGQELFVFYGKNYAPKIDISMDNYCKWFNSSSSTIPGAIASDWVCDGDYEPEEE